MKKVCIFVITCLLLSCSSDKQRLYGEIMNQLQLNIGSNRYNALIDIFEEFDGRFPDSLMEVYLAYKQDYPEDIVSIEMRHFMDIFNKKGRWVGYFPIYNSDDTKIISYILLSAGIDGKLDNILEPSDKLHLDNWKEKLNLYNPDEFDYGDAAYYKYLNDSYADGIKLDCRKGYINVRPYSMWEEKFGTKDLLIHLHHLGGCIK